MSIHLIAVIAVSLLGIAVGVLDDFKVRTSLRAIADAESRGATRELDQLRVDLAEGRPARLRRALASIAALVLVVVAPWLIKIAGL